MAAANKFGIVLVQMLVRTNKQENLKRAAELVAEAAKKSPTVVALPECFNSPYGVKFFPEYAETIPGETTSFLSQLAKEHSIFLIGGTIPEKDGTKLYNTCTVFGPDGTMVAKYRKLHLFDIDVPGRMTFKESDALSPGDDLVTFQLPQCKIGVGICYDMRFAELAQIYAKSGCKLLIYPGAFNMTTGPAHWELLQRARAVDNQVFVAAVSVARDPEGSYVAWGFSSIVNSWGEVTGKLDDKEGILHGEIDLNHLAEVRQQIPITLQRRKDLYRVENLVDVN